MNLDHDPNLDLDLEALLNDPYLNLPTVPWLDKIPTMENKILFEDPSELEQLAAGRIDSNIHRGRRLLCGIEPD